MHLHRPWYHAYVYNKSIVNKRFENLIFVNWKCKFCTCYHAKEKKQKRFGNFARTHLGTAFTSFLILGGTFTHNQVADNNNNNSASATSSHMTGTWPTLAENQHITLAVFLVLTTWVCLHYSCHLYADWRTAAQHALWLVGWERHDQQQWLKNAWSAKLQNDFSI